MQKVEIKKIVEKKRDRVEIVFSLAKYCHQDWYHEMIKAPTPRLQAMLEWCEGKRGVPKNVLDLRQTLKHNFNGSGGGAGVGELLK